MAILLVLQSFTANNFLMGYMEHLEVNIEGTFTEKLKRFLMYIWFIQSAQTSCRA